MESLKNNLLGYSELEDTDMDALLKVYTEVKVPMGEYVFKEGSVTDKIYFIKKGVITYFSEIDGDESVIEFYSDNSFHTNAYSYFTMKPSVCSAIAEEDTTLLVAKKQDLEDVFESSMNLQRFGRKFSELVYLTVLRRNYEKQIFSNEERYLRFLDKRYDLSQRIPQYKIASYLNITAVGLSKIRKRIFTKGRA